MLVRVADEARQSGDGGVEVGLVSLGNFFKGAQERLVRVNGHAFQGLSLPDFRAAASLAASFSAI